MSFALPKYRKTTLQNGFEIYHAPLNEGSSVINIDLFYRVGSRNEVMGKSGIAHMLEHLNFKSTKTRPAGEFDRIVKGFGGINNASTGFDYTHYFIKCSRDNLEISLDLYADMMENLSLKDEEFQPERAVVLEERRWRTDNNPLGLLYFKLFNTAFTHHSYHWTPIGFYSDIENWSIDDIRAFHKSYYQPQNAFLMVTGDISGDGVSKLAKKYFENIKNRGEIPKIHAFEPEINSGERSATIYFDSEVQMLAIGYKIPPFNHADMPGLNALSELLSGGKSAILNRVLIEQKQLVNEIYAYPMDCIDDGLFIIIAVCNPGVKASAVKDEIEALIMPKSIKTGDLNRIKNSLKSDLAHTLSSASGTANLIGSYIARGDLGALESLQVATEMMSSKTILNCAKKYFKNENQTTIYLKGRV